MVSPGEKYCKDLVGFLNRNIVGSMNHSPTLILSQPNQKRKKKKLSLSFVAPYQIQFQFINIITKSRLTTTQELYQNISFPSQLSLTSHWIILPSLLTKNRILEDSACWYKHQTRGFLNLFKVSFIFGLTSITNPPKAHGRCGYVANPYPGFMWNLLLRNSTFHQKDWLWILYLDQGFEGVSIKPTIKNQLIIHQCTWEMVECGPAYQWHYVNFNMIYTWNCTINIIPDCSPYVTAFQVS